MEVVKDPSLNYNVINSFVFNPIIIIIILLLIAAYFILSSGDNTMSNEMSSSSSSSSSSPLLIIILVILVIIIILNVLQYCFNIDTIQLLNDLLNPVAEIESQVEPEVVKKPLDISLPFNRKQVFNIPGNTYTYEDGKALCKAYGGDLATYKQIEDAYDNGGEWCNYGWSDKQMALFPTQQNTYDNLQKIKNHEHDCGRPGVNGGFIANPNVKFGVNCYGNKPRMNSNEEELMKTMTPYPETKQDLEFQQKVDFWKNKANEILLSPFNYNSWGEL